MGKKKIFVILISIGLIGSFSWTYISKINDKKHIDTEISRDTSVLVQKIGQASYGDKIKYSGKLSYGEEQNIMSMVDEKVVYIGAKEGDHVKKGDIILKFDSSEIDKNLNKAKNDYLESINKSKESLEKLNGVRDTVKNSENEIKGLNITKENLNNEIKDIKNNLNILEEKKHIISIEDYEKSKEDLNKKIIEKEESVGKISVDIKAKEIEILALNKTLQGIDKINIKALEDIGGGGQSKLYEQIEKLKEAYVVKAPIDGKITNLNAFLNDKIENKIMPAVTISNDNILEMKFGVDEEYLSNFKVGDKIDVQIENEKNVYKDIGTVKKIDKKSDIRTGQYNVYIEINNNGNYKINDYISLFLKNNSNISKDMISKNCLIREGDKTFVYVVKDNIVNKKEVKTGEEGTHKVRIKEGLNTEDLVIEKGKEYVKEGQKVNIVEGDK